MNDEPKKMSAASTGHRNKVKTEQTGNRDVSGFTSRKKPGLYETGGEPVHISQEEAQSIPVDEDPDDPVSR
jgi:hypothetical protein